MLNPFPVGVPVSGRNLVGRDKEISEIYQLLHDHQSIVLIAPRRYGKTSVLLALLKKLKTEKYITCDIDLFSVVNKRHLAERIAEAVLQSSNTPIKNLIRALKINFTSVLRNVEFKAIIEKFEFVLNLADREIDDDTLLEQALDFAERYAQENNKEIIFAYDEFNDILRIGSELLLKQMRAKFQRHNNVTYIFTGSQESIMRKIFCGKANVFFRFARVINLDLIDKDSFSKYIQHKFSSLEISIKPEAIDEILIYTDGHPFYTQLLCQTIYYNVKGQKNNIEIQDVKENYNKVLLAERTSFDELIRELSTRKHFLEIMLKIACEENPYRLEIPTPNISRILNKLEDTGYIKRCGKGVFEIYDKFFKSYIKELFN